MEPKGSIDLLPQVTVEEVQEIEKKGKINLSGVFFIFIVVFISLFILGANLYARNQFNTKSQELADSETEVQNLQYVEVKQKTFNNKFDTFTAVQNQDFKSDKVLEYLMEVSSDLSVVDTLYLDNELSFEIKGSTENFSNVSRLWHEMCTQSDYFSIVNLEYARKGSKGDITFSFSGVLNPEGVDNL